MHIARQMEMNDVVLADLKSLRTLNAHSTIFTSVSGLCCPELTSMGLDTGFAMSHEIAPSFEDNFRGYPYL